MQSFLKKQFIKEAGQVDSYENVEVKYISGHNPDLVTFNDNGKVLERVDLTKFSSLEALHELMIQKGFIRKPAQGKLIEEEEETVQPPGNAEL